MGFCLLGVNKIWHGQTTVLLCASFLRMMFLIYSRAGKVKSNRYCWVRINIRSRPENNKTLLNIII